LGLFTFSADPNYVLAQTPQSICIKDMGERVQNGHAIVPYCCRWSPACC